MKENKMPNGPATDSLTIRHTLDTVPGGARPGWGLPFEQLPSAITPESMLREQIQTGKQQIQDKYALQWKEISRSARFIGPTKANRMLQEIDTRAKQEMLQFNQQAQQQFEQLQNIDRLAQQGAINNPDEIKARIAFGADVAKSIYPTPEKELSVPEEFGKLDVYSHRISQELERFKEEKPRKPGILAGISPLATAISVYRGLREPKRKVRIWDFTTGDWRKTLATPEEIAEYDMWSREQKDVATRKKELTGRLGISRRIVQPGTKGGTFSDKIAESVRPQRVPTVTKPKIIRQRSKLTGQIRESYDGGKTWQIVSG